MSPSVKDGHAETPTTQRRQRSSSRSSVRDLVRRASNASSSSLHSLKDRIFGRRRSSNVSSVSQARPPANPAIVEQLREAVRAEMELKMATASEQDSVTKKFDSRDVNYVLTDSQFLPRVVTEYHDESDSNTIQRMVKVVTDCLRLRKKYDFFDVQPEEFPSEIYDTDSACGYEKPGEPVYVFLRVKYVTKIPPFDYMYTRYLIAHVNRLIHRMKDRSLNIVVDCTGLSFGQLDLIVHIAWTMYGAFPGWLGSCYIIELPFVMKAGLYVMLKVFPERIRSKIFIDSASGTIDTIGPDRCPSFIGGTGDANLEWSSDPEHKPANCITMEELAIKMNASKAVVEKAKKAVLTALKQANKEKANR